MLNEKCCFNIPDNYKNVTKLIQLMKDSIRVPPARPEWDWFGDRSDWSLGSWKEWAFGRILYFGFALIDADTMCNPNGSGMYV